MIPKLAAILKQPSSITTGLRACNTRIAITAKKTRTFFIFSQKACCFTSDGNNEGHNTTDNDEVSSSSWPSSEHAAFAFTALAKPGRKSITLDEFLQVTAHMNLGFNLSAVELKRVFQHLDANGDGQVSLEEFQAGRKTSPLTIAMVEALTNNNNTNNNRTIMEEEQQQTGTTTGNAVCVLWNHIFPSKKFDPTVSTAENYKVPLEDGFVGENKAIREVLDYKYHTNYTHERQHFQDHVIRQNVLLSSGKNNRTDKQHRPLLVHTCGSMGVGKGYVLGWMSANGIISLERISKIDPDTFKLRLPEWPVYLQNSLELAGTLTHEESGYIAEIAAHVAMNNKMNVWVDGSLRNYQWYERHFDTIREKWPDYRIAILAIDASVSDQIIHNRLQERASRTGRHVPEDLFRESSRGINEGLRRLIPKIDLMAHIINDESSTDEGPKLSALSIIDNSGNWDLIKQLS